MANATSTQLQELYVAYFGRAADPTGLDYWTVEGISTSKFAADMYAAAEFEDSFGSLSVEAQVNQIYKNLFDRDADVDGLTYWTQQINLGVLKVAEIANDLIYAAQNNAGSEDDLTALTNRTNAAIAYTAEVKSTAAGILAYQAKSSAADSFAAGVNFTEAKTYLAGIDKDTPHTDEGVTASVATIVANGDPATYTAPVVVVPDPTYTVSASASSIDEGSTLTTTLTTTNVDSGTKVHYELSGTGVTNNDFSSGSLTGSATVGSDGTVSISHTLDSDLATEGKEILEVAIYSDSGRETQIGETAYVTINDTSEAAVNAVLTTGLDTGSAFVGTAGNDTFSGLNTTLTAGDVMKGGDGTDTFSLTSDLAANTTLAGFTTESIETFSVTLLDGDTATAETLTVNMLNSAPTTINLQGTTTSTLSDRATFTNVAAGTNLSVANSTDLHSTVTYLLAARAGTADEATLTLDTVANTVAADTDINFTSGGTAATSINVLNVVTTGGASNIGDLTFGGATLNVTGDQNLTIDDDLAGTVDLIDASAFTGRLNIDVADDTTTPDATVSDVDSVDITVKSGTGADTIDLVNVGADNEILVESGAGNDVVTIGAVLANSSSTSAGDVLNGGEGTDTLTADVDLIDTAILTGANSTSLTGVSGFETLNLSGAMGGTDAVVLSRISSDLNRVNISSVTAGTGLTLTYGSGDSTLGLNVVAAVSAADTLTATASGSGTSDTLTITNMLTAGETGSATSAYDLNGFETVTFNTGSYATTAAQNVNTIDVGSNTLNITGANGLTTGGAITATTIDGSGATGAIVFGAAAASVTTITGGSGADTLTGDASSTIDGKAGNDTITGGANNDTLTGGTGNDTITTAAGVDTVDAGAGDDTVNVDNQLSAGDVIAGGEGTDTLAIDALATAATAASVSGFEILRYDTGALGAQSMANFTANAGFTTIDANVAGLITTTNATSTVTTLRSTTTGGSHTFSRLIDGSTDSITVEADTGTDNDATVFAAVTANDEETITLTSGSHTDEDLTVTDLAATDLTTLTLTGEGDVIITNAITNATSLATVNASGVTGATTVNAGVSTVDLTMTAGNGGATFTGGSGDDTLTGGTGVDVLTGGTGADTISAGAGADTTIDGGAGADTLTGGAGDDNFVMTVTEGVSATSIIDNTTGNAIAATIAMGAGDKIVFGNGVDQITDFTAGGTTDDINTLVAGAALATGIGVSNTDMVAGGADDIFFFSGAYNTSNNTFTVAADGTGVDTLITVIDQDVAEDMGDTNGHFILRGVDSDDLVAADFI